MSERLRPNRIRALISGAALGWVLTGHLWAAEQGLASWYGRELHGQIAASGEVYDAEALTAAHRTLPFGTTVRVRRVDGDRSVVVRINDRGPYFGERIIDVSEAAARQLGMLQPGVVNVAVEILSPGQEPVALTVSATGFAVQVGTFRVPENARRMRGTLGSGFGPVHFLSRGEALTSVVVGDGLTETDAQALALRIRGTRPEYAGAFVIRLDSQTAQVSD
jgi:peptidoglycan lytic transglycosylase